MYVKLLPDWDVNPRSSKTEVFGYDANQGVIHLYIYIFN